MTVLSDTPGSRLSYTVVSVTGDIDLAAAGPLETELSDVLAAGRLHAILDMTSVRFLDSSGMTAIVKAHNHFHAAGGQLRLVITNRRVRMPLELTQLSTILAIYDSLESARADWVAIDTKPPD